ncbi:MAG: prepilin-type N-terminal cleavage/methylation domain-containing protein [Armatimonadota bacterium]|nr:prepilin-type N-terminal cleavage/methylation domain-containing protein [Armatimonadota bacterium]MDR7451942.1 prepilin-type N-terminal cleavage/methylation domain-containing protein [Armatimonadota bacterium]MDR7466624.1 prepilin-type N-terminal cleavage/methylation domain-containing protein [Armatimonadota bacterium]MDR7492902.1 prepilin-type N-terminal cleavage/methylation domain-containing protein [Armatimonadota bacterium]MDR7500429.1 prepilin-type N-terminal cleavage/methylation domain
MRHLRRQLWKARTAAAGFTLIEIAVVIAIIGLLVAIALPSFLGARQKAYSAEVRQIASEWKALDFSCLVEKNFNTSRCDTAAEMGWTPPPNSAVWNFSGYAIECLTAANADAALIGTAATCTVGAPAATEWMRLSVPGVAGGDMNGKTYRMVVGAGASVRGLVGDLITP